MRVQASGSPSQSAEVHLDREHAAAVEPHAEASLAVCVPRDNPRRAPVELRPRLEPCATWRADLLQVTCSEKQ